MRREENAEAPAPSAGKGASPGPEGETTPPQQGAMESEREATPREDMELWEAVQQIGESKEEEGELLGTLPKITLGAGVFLTVFVIGYLAVNGLATLPYEPEWPVPGANPERGRVLIQDYGCGSCHRIPGILNANGRVGPNLEDLGGQVYIGGQLPNAPEHLAAWIRNPQRFAPGTAMPNLGVTEADAWDIAAYLYGKR